MLGSLIVNFDHATADGVVDGSLACSDLDDIKVSVGDTIGIMDGGAGPYEAEVVEVDGDNIRVRAPMLMAPPSRPGLAGTDDLERWADAPRAWSEFPGLIRDLLADIPRVTGLSMRAGRGVVVPGWDGTVDGGAGAPYVPPGRSCWELGTGRDPGRKAQQDYRKRTDDPKGADPTKTTFVFVTPRRWAGKDEWAMSKRAEGEWRDVRVLDADDLEGWLRSRYRVHIRFSEQLGLRSREVQSLEQWWKQWSGSTHPPLPADLLVAGRGRQVKKLRERLARTPSITGVRAASQGEALAFVAAALRRPDGAGPADAAAVVVHTAAAWDDWSAETGRSVLIPRFEGADVAAAVRSGLHVVVPMEDEHTGQAIELPRIGRWEARAAFEAIGVPSAKAGRYANRARLSLSSLRRGLTLDPSTARPAWAQTTDDEALAVLVLVGSWSENREADRETVASIVNREFESVERLLRRWENTGDPPFRRSGSSWRLSNPEDAWLLLNRRIIREDLKRWREAVLQVLGTRDPLRDMDALDCFKVSIRGMEQRWSFDLRRGLAQGVALLASLELPRSVGGRTGSGHAESLVRDLLDRAGDDDTGWLWQQLSDVLPLLAEAAPSVLLDAVRRDSEGDAPLLQNMFADSESFMPSPHTGLLWALERVCWSPEYLPAAMDALLKLAEIDPGGRSSHRPMESARLVLWPMSPQTGASLDRRMATLDGLVKRFPSAGRELLLELVPRPGTYWTDNDKPRFRDWPPFKEPSEGEIRRSVEAIRSRATSMESHADRGADPISSKLEELARAHADLFGWQPHPETERPTVLEQRCGVVQDVFDLGRFGALSTFAGRVPRPELVGSVTALRLGDKLTEGFLPFLTNAGTDRELALGWLSRMAELHGTDWAVRILQDNPGLTDEARADILLTLPPAKEVWKLLAEEHEGVGDSYWRLVRRRKVEPEHFDTYLDKLLQYDRVRFAVEVSWFRSKQDPPEHVENGTIARVLTSASQVEAGRFRDADLYRIGQLMDLLGPGSETVASLEGHLFLPLRMIGRSPAALHCRLLKEPSFFVDLVCQVYSRAGKPPQMDASRMTVPHGSPWSILQGWRIPPGHDAGGGEWDIDTLKSWVREARRRLRERDRSDIGDMLIGELLSGSPTGTDGTWPAEPIRELVEALDSERLEDGLVSGAVTSRGRTAHRMLEGGEQERGLGGLYREMASKIETRWLRSAEVLRRLADYYEEEARQRDEQAERLADFD